MGGFHFQRKVENNMHWRITVETALPELIAVIENPVARVLADGAYDGAGVSNCLTEAFGTDVEITIPPPITAVLGVP
jgi:hypothetical protein